MEAGICTDRGFDYPVGSPYRLSYLLLDCGALLGDHCISICLSGGSATDTTEIGTKTSAYACYVSRG